MAGSPVMKSVSTSVRGISCGKSRSTATSRPGCSGLLSPLYPPASLHCSTARLDGSSQTVSGRGASSLRPNLSWAARHAAHVRPRRLLGCSFRRNSPVLAMAVTGLERAEPVQTPEVEKLLDTIKWNSSGLVVAIAQDIDTGAILMQGFANRDAISATLASRRATFFSRSRSSLWTKGESSRNFINVVDVFLDCDRDSIIYLGSPDGPTCHTGAETCYFVSASASESNDSTKALTTLYSLEATIDQRKAETSAKPSWTKKLVEKPDLLCSKIREEADELCRTIEKNEGRDRTVSEMADLLYHSMVLLAVQDVKVKEVLEVLRGRFAKSGIEEKKNRSSN